MLDFVTLVLLIPAKSMSASKYGKQRKNGKEITKNLKKMVKNDFLEKTRNFSAQFDRETRAWPDGADPLHFDMHIEKIGQFFKIRVSPQTQVRLCVDGPHKTAGDLQNTPGTPAVDVPLFAAGSQSALYAFGKPFCLAPCA